MAIVPFLFMTFPAVTSPRRPHNTPVCRTGARDWQAPDVIRRNTAAALTPKSIIVEFTKGHIAQTMNIMTHFHLILAENTV